MEDDLVDKYYNGFSNDILWPLFHYVPLPMFKVAGGKKFDRTLWEVRRLFFNDSKTAAALMNEKKRVFAVFFSHSCFVYNAILRPI